MRIYVGNLSYSTTPDSLRGHFGEFGTVDDVHIVTDRETGRPRGFGFVEMPNDEEGQEAIDSLNGQNLDGRPLTVNLARPRAPRDGGFGGGGGGGRRW